ncbi:hypothetical protein GLE_1097 [Lysobacter enzymogenes]|uniref:Uncharacterized protein n=1 Tax=Lysobacter enzymogenes TaxID=69 RepID=A0A0S2DD88_LYSEN|nr:hypothetical protein GLE_1097 [Lysobacter enzymogenes]
MQQNFGEKARWPQRRPRERSVARKTAAGRLTALQGRTHTRPYVMRLMPAFEWPASRANHPHKP